MNNTQPKTMEERLDEKIIDGSIKWNGNKKNQISVERLRTFIRQEIHLAEEALRENIREEIENSLVGIIVKNSRGMVGRLLTECDPEIVESDVLSLPILQITKQ